MVQEGGGRDGLGEKNTRGSAEGWGVWVFSITVGCLANLPTIDILDQGMPTAWLRLFFCVLSDQEEEKKKNAPANVDGLLCDGDHSCMQ
ncbi:hypothetical protein CEXT_435691 [Caerostris extrusa]|uniref:Uncharacterized protein n=1 Tax=Caerostris extrusa TaxID=172846 RepID=A0AAV4QR92_CAEEX|nr:hypothetical protein CEXT_435691 [Caerostris extrusa]